MPDDGKADSLKAIEKTAEAKQPQRESADVQNARAAGGGDLKAAESTRTNASTGSLGRASGKNWRDQDNSIELTYGDRVASRTQKLTEAELTAAPSDVSAKKDIGQTSPEQPHTKLFGYISADDDKAWRQISELPERTQVEIIATAIRAQAENWTQEQVERQLGALTGAVQGTSNVLQDIATITDFSAACIIGDKETASKMGGEAGTAIGKTIVSGVQLFTLSEKYLNDLGAEGDCLKPFKDIKELGDSLNKRWSELPPHEQERIKYQFAVETGASIASPAVAAKMYKAAKFTELLEITSQIGTNLTAELGPAAALANKNAATIASQIKEMAGPFDTGLRPQLVDGPPLYKAIPEPTAPNENIFYSKAKPVDKPIIRSEDHAGGFRGDHDPYGQFHPKGWRKSYVSADGELVPANPSGLYKGQAVTAEDHIDAGWNRYRKGNSPFTSFSVTDGILGRYGDGKSVIKLDLKALREAIDSGTAPEVSILEHSELIKVISESDKLKPFAKVKQLRNVMRDNEILVKGTIPKRFITVEN